MGRSIDWEEGRGGARNRTGSARLVRHIRVISPDDLPSWGGASLAWGDTQPICLSPLSFFTGLTVLLAGLAAALSALTVLWLRVRHRGRPASSCDDPRLNHTLLFLQ